MCIRDRSEKGSVLNRRKRGEDGAWKSEKEIIRRACFWKQALFIFKDRDYISLFKFIWKNLSRKSMMFERIFERWYSTIEIKASGRLWGPEASRLFREQRMSETSSGEVGEVKKEFRLLFLSQSEKWCRVKGIFERTLSAIVEKKSLKTSETVEGSDVIELSSFNEILEGEFVDFEEQGTKKE